MSTKKIGQYYRKSFQDFSGGLNDFDSALIVKQNQFTELENARVNDRGLLEKTKGYSVDGSPFPDDADSFIRMVANYKRGTTVDKLICAALDEGNANATYKIDLKQTSGDGSYDYVAHTTGTALFTNASTAVVGTGTAWLSHLKAGDKIKASSHADGVYAEISSITNDTNLVLTANYTGATTLSVAYKARIILNGSFIPQGVTFNDNFVITNGSDSLITFNNTTANLITDADTPKCKFIEPHKSRIFTASTSGAPSSIFWSAVNDETSWDATSAEPVYPKDGGAICAIKSFADSLIVLKDNGKIYQVVGSFDQSAVGEPDFIRKVDTPENMGTIAGFTAAVGNDNRLYFLTQTGIYSLDSRMGVEKVSWNIENLVSSVTLRSGATSAKSYPYDTKTQWDAGTHSGTLARSDGKLRPYFDTLTITDAYKANGSVSVAMDTSNNVYIAYISTDRLSVKYKKLLASDNSVEVTETVATTTEAVYSVSIAVDSTTPGIAWKQNITGGTQVKYSKRTGGTWSTPETALSTATAMSIAGNNYDAIGISLRFRSDGLPRIATAGKVAADTNGLSYCKRDGSAVWTAITYFASNDWIVNCALWLHADGDPRIAVTRHKVTGGAAESSQLAILLTGSGGETTLTASETTGSINFSSTGNYGITLQKTSGGTYFSTYMEGNTLTRKQWGGSTATPGTGTTSYNYGYVINSSDEHNYYESFSPSGTRVENFIFENTNAVDNTSNTTNDYWPGDKGMFANGDVYASAAFGVNANEIIIRRLTYSGVYTSDERSDSTLSAWGVYDVVGESSSGNTILHQVALASASPVSSYTTVTDGSTISTDSTLVFVRFKVTFTLAAFAASEVDSVTLNYDGIGVGPLLPCGVVFDNEYYISYGTSGDSANSGTILYDSGQVFATSTYPVTFMARYKGTLYAGGSTTGKIYKLLTGYRFNSSAYTMSAISKEDLLGSLELEKEVYKIYVLYEIKSTGTIDFSYRVDNFKTSGGATWVTTTIDQTEDGISEVSYIGSPFRSIQFKIENDEFDAQVGIIGFVVLYDYLGLR